jgi:hypothetical protein
LLQAVTLWERHGNSKESALRLGRAMERYRRGKAPYDTPFAADDDLRDWWDDLPLEGEGAKEMTGMGLILSGIVPHGAEVERLFAGKRLGNGWACRRHAACHHHVVVMHCSAQLNIRIPPDVQLLATTTAAGAATWTSRPP